jgi:hypothetical protein
MLKRMRASAMFDALGRAAGYPDIHPGECELALRNGIGLGFDAEEVAAALIEGCYPQPPVVEPDTADTPATDQSTEPRAAAEPASEPGATTEESDT